MLPAANSNHSQERNIMAIPAYFSNPHRERIEHFDDERTQENGYIITLQYSWSFYPNEHCGVKGFDTIADARDAIAGASPCTCNTCKANQGQ
jgi:hypothetical protein